jgi:hypothetical protein
MSDASPLTLRRILGFWLPLAATWLMMATEGPFLAAVIARLAEPTYNLAAYGVAYALALVVEAPIIMMMSASTALVKDRISYLKLRNFTNTLNAGLTVIMLVLLLPPVFGLVAQSLIGLPAEVARRTHLAVLLLLPWPGTIGVRRFYHGILIRSGRTRLVAAGTVIRLLTMACTATSLALGTTLAGAAVGAAALSAGVTVEAVVARLMAARDVRRLLGIEERGVAHSPGLSYPAIVRFYVPLALTSVLALAVHPMVTFFMGHARRPLESLAVLPVVLSLVFVFRSLGLAYQEVAIALAGDDERNLRQLTRFAAVLALAVVAGLATIAWTPLAHVWFQGLSGLSPELAAFAAGPTRILALIPGLTVVLSFQRSIMVIRGSTAHVTWATVVEVVGVVTTLAVAIHVLDAVGAVAAAAALLLGRICGNLYLVPPVVPVIRRSGEGA